MARNDTLNGVSPQMADRSDTPPPLGASPPAWHAPARRAERRLAVGALAAELGHELQGPFNLFRLNADRLARGEALDEEDFSLLAEELERLARLNRRLRELARVPGDQSACTPRMLVALAQVGSSAELEIDVPDDVSLRCDRLLLSHALRELVDNALEAKATRAGIRFEAGSAPGFCVWDDGPGFTLSVESALAWGVTTRPFAAGLGLTLALRAVRAHAFELALRRTNERTEAWVSMPAHALTSLVAP
jgi:signal transduction histidine kinase